MEHRKDSAHSNQGIRRKIEMRYQSDKKDEAPKSISCEIKKLLIAYHINSAGPQRERKSERAALRECGFCQATQTSLWRRIGDVLVCNACGLYYRIHGKIRDKAAKHPGAALKPKRKE